eukprot:scaffold2751_cov266-Pinguiococcus_pyrenoidosus.AAC.5
METLLHSASFRGNAAPTSTDNPERRQEHGASFQPISSLQSQTFLKVATAGNDGVREPHTFVPGDRTTLRQHTGRQGGPSSVCQQRLTDWRWASRKSAGHAVPRPVGAIVAGAGRRKRRKLLSWALPPRRRPLTSAQALSVADTRARMKRANGEGPGRRGGRVRRRPRRGILRQFKMDLDGKGQSNQTCLYMRLIPF